MAQSDERKAICGARKRNGEGVCQLPAGWGTDHPGTGRCKLHGGCAVFYGADNPAYKHGRYSKYLSPEEQVEFEEFKRSLGPELDFEEEVLIGLFRGYRQIASARPIPMKVGDEVVLVEPDPRYIMQCTDLATKSLERLRQSREGVTVNVQFADDQLRALLEGVGRAIGRHVSDPAEREAVIAELRALMTGAGDGE